MTNKKFWHRSRKSEEDLRSSKRHANKYKLKDFTPIATQPTQPPKLTDQELSKILRDLSNL